MIDPYRSKWVAGLVLLAVLTFFGTCNYIDHLRARAIKAEDQASLAQAKVAGLNEALTAKPKEVVKFVEVPKEVVRLVKEGRVAPVAGVKIVTEVKEVPLPCPAKNDSVTDGTVIKAEGLGVQTKFDLFIGVAGAKPVWSGQAQTDLTAPNYRQSVAWTSEELKGAGSEIVFSKEVLEAIKQAQYRPNWFKRHFKIACPGFGVHYGLVHQQFDYGPTCGAAFVW